MKIISKHEMARWGINLFAIVVLAALLYFFWWLGRCAYHLDWMPLMERPIDRLVAYVFLIYSAGKAWHDPPLKRYEW